MINDKQAKLNNDHYVYMWKYPEGINDGVAFYVGQGKYNEKYKYKRAHAIHYQDSKRRRSYAQCVFDKLTLEGAKPIIVIVADDLTVDEANTLERLLIAEHGRRNINTGVLCNLTEGGEINPMNDIEVRIRQLNAVRSHDNRSSRSKSAREINSRPEVIKKHIMNSKKMWGDSTFKNRMVAKHNSLETLEKHRKVQSEISGIKIELNGIVYRSKNELARTLGISSQLLTYRIKNNIQLDLPCASRVPRSNK